MLTIILGVTFSNNAITNKVDYDRNTGHTYMSMGNVNGNRMFVLQSRYYFPISSKNGVTFNGSSYLASQRNREYVNGLQTVNDINALQNVSISYEHSKFSVTAAGKLDYHHLTSPRTDFQTLNYFNYNYGISGLVKLPWHFELSSDVTMFCRRGFNDESMNTNQFICNAQVSRNFLNEKLLVRLIGYDLFGNIDSVTQTLNAYGRIEKWSNVLTRYAMISFCYRFNKQPKKK